MEDKDAAVRKEKAAQDAVKSQHALRANLKAGLYMCTTSDTPAGIAEKLGVSASRIVELNTKRLLTLTTQISLNHVCISAETPSYVNCKTIVPCNHRMYLQADTMCKPKCDTPQVAANRPLNAGTQGSQRSPFSSCTLSSCCPGKGPRTTPSPSY